ncbi:NYN domain-containing protein [Falsihalocynthiibacter arcticus]|uniref:Maebl n=1 Tax=Falsihalocynthiibacter arcticus TaxID=1579316 RepID=A0A126V3H2_9RHOB|nr:NYN domain-containing protein [Falsihalocynthiibacter arcticus]AML52858.1 Maebl [Falsihalocynthiibacter arcticus]
MLARNQPIYAVLIDADNIPAKHAEVILKEIKTFGEPALRRVYGDWSSEQLRGWAETVREHGLVAHQETANTKGKNASDIGLVIDAMDILHTTRFDGFVLVSSDSDFTALANRIREQGLQVIGIGERKTPESLRNVCNRFVFIENLIEEPASTIDGKQTKSTKLPAKGAAPLIVAAMDKIEQDDDWYSLSALGKQIMAANSDFDTRTYGYKKLSELVGNLNQFEIRKIGTTLSVRYVIKSS